METQKKKDLIKEYDIENTLLMDYDIENNTLIDNYSKLEEYYDIFYKNIVETVKVYYIYIENSKITSVKKDILILNNGVLDRDILNTIINQKSEDSILNKRYNLRSILKYNIDIDQEDIEKLLDNNHLINKIDVLDNNYFSIIDNIIDIKLDSKIKFNDTITLLQDVNSLYFLFEKKQIRLIAKTQKKKI